MRQLRISFVLLAFLFVGCGHRPNPPMHETPSRQPNLFPLPADDIPQAVRKSLHPWIAGFIGLTPQNATARLHERWASIDRPSLKALRQTLSEFEVRGIVDYEQGGLIYAVRRDSEESLVGNSLYLPAAMDREELADRLRTMSLSENQAVLEFMVHFGGMRESIEYEGQFTCREEPWPTFTDPLGDNPLHLSIDAYDEWKGSLIIYKADTGHDLLVHKSGKVAWYIMQELRIDLKADTFDEFILDLSEYKKVAWPLDAYGPPRRVARP